MSINKSRESGEWDQAIEMAKKRIQRLQAAIRTFEESKAKGEKWPGTLPLVKRAAD